MVSCTSVPYPSDDADAIAQAVSAIRQQAGILHGQVALGERIGQGVSAGWVGDAADRFAEHHTAVIAHGYGVTASHAHVADALDHYRAGVEDCQQASRRGQSRIEEATAEHNRQVAWHVDTMRERVARLTREAQDKVDQAGNDLEHLNLAGMFGDLFQAGQDALNAAADQLALLGQASAALDGWSPVALPADRDPVRAGYPVKAWPADAVTADLHTAGGFLFTAAVGGVEMFLSLADDVITGAVDGIRGAERDVASGIAAIQQDVSDAFTTLDRVGTAVGHELENITYSAAEIAVTAGTAVFHATVTGMEQTAHAFDQAAHIVAQDVADDVAAVGKWVSDPHTWETVSDVLGTVATVAGVLSLVPGLGEILLPVSAIAMGLKTADDIALAATGAYGKDGWKKVVADGIDDALLGGGEALGAAVKGLNLAANADRAVTAADSAAQDADRTVESLQEAADAETDEDIKAVMQSRVDEAADKAADAHADVSAAQDTAKELHEQSLTQHLWQGAKSQWHDDVHMFQTSRNASRELLSIGKNVDGLSGRLAGMRSYVSNAQQAATASRAGRYVFGANNLIQEGGIVHDLPDTVHTIQSWLTPGLAH